MGQLDLIAIVDFGTSDIRCVVAKRNHNNVISILEHHSVNAENSVRRGIIYNVELAAGMLKKLMNAIHNKLGGIKIAKVYVTLGGQSVFTHKITEEMQLIPPSHVKQEMVDSLWRKARAYKPDLTTNYGIVDVEYFVDQKSETRPVGVSCDKLEADFTVVVGRPNLLNNIKKVVESCNLELAGYFVSSVASAELLLEEQDRKLGCVLVDFGAGTTDVSIYHNGILRYLSTIPLGGRSITQDITAMNFLEDEAEKYKLKFGKAKESKPKSRFASPFASKQEVDMVELNKVISFRLTEIIANIKEQIRLSGFQDKLGAGMLITGGASELTNLEEELSEKLKMEVRRVYARKDRVNNAHEVVSNLSYSPVLGAMFFAEENCQYIEPKVTIETGATEHEEVSTAASRDSNRKRGGMFWKGGDSSVESKKTKDTSSVKDKMRGFFDNLFVDEVDDE